MYIELIDLLRCPREHADSWLVAAFNKMDGRFVVEGKLGCPVCSATYWIRDGIADLSEAEYAITHGCSGMMPPDEETAVRAAALLGLTNPNSLVVLAGESAYFAQLVAGIAEARVIALNPGVKIDESEKVAVVLTDERLPLAPSSIDGIMLTEFTAAFAPDASRVLRQGGRLVVPKGTPLPAGFRTLAEDDREIVAESIGQLITLSR